MMKKTAAEPKTVYVVAPGRTAWHTKENQPYEEGQEIDLSHLTDHQIAAVLQSGVVTVKESNKETENDG